MNASSTDSRRVCAFRLSCFVFCEITASLPSCRPSGRSFCILVPDTPGPEFVGNSRERARRSPARGFHRFGPPLGAAPKPAAPLGVSHGEVRKPTAPPGLLHGEARKSTTPPGLLHGEARKPTRRPDFFTAKRESRPRRPDFFTAKRESRQRRSPLPGREIFRPRGRPERRASL